MWIKSIYGKADLKRLKLYIYRAGRGTVTSECQWHCGLQWGTVRIIGSGLGYGTHSLVFFIRGSRFRDITGDGTHPAMIGSLAYLWNLLFFQQQIGRLATQYWQNKIASRLSGGWGKETEAL
jgi:hypothetical protein